MKRSISTAAAAFAVALALSLSHAAKAETFIAPFTSPSGTETTGLYSGVVQVTVSGVGDSDGSQLDDAFYLLNASNANYPNAVLVPSGPPPYTSAGADPGFYDLGFSTNGGGLNPVGPSLVGSYPSYSPDNTYTFDMNTGLVTPGNLWFGNVDNDYGDNGGQFQITIGSSTPEPGAFALIGSLGLTAAGILRRRRAR